MDSSALQELDIDAIGRNVPGLPLDRLAELRRAYQDGRWPDADQLVTALLHQHDHVAALHVVKGRVDEHQGRSQRAADRYRRAVDLDPDLLEPRLMLAVVESGQGRDGEAVAACESVLSRQPSCRPALLLMAAIAEARGDWQTALPFLQRAVHLDPSDLDALTRLFAAQSNLPDPNERRLMLERLLPRSPHRAPILFQLAYLAQEAKAWERAYALLRQVVQADPQLVDGHVHLAYVSQVLGRWADAADGYARALLASPDRVDWWTLRGRALMRAAKLADAEACFEEVVRLTPADGDAWRTLWDLRRQRGDRHGAAEAGRGALELNPGSRADQLDLLSTQHAADQVDDALRHCRALAQSGCEDVAWPRFMDVLKDLVKVPPRPLPDDRPRTWDYFHYNRDKVLAMIEAALTIRQRFPHTPRVFVGQGLIVWEKTMGFLDDDRFIACTRKYDHLRMMVNWEWNLHVIQWAARQALAIPGDFVELGVYRGYTTAVTAENLDFGRQDRRWYLYDTFAGIPADQRTDGWPHAYAGMESNAWYEEVTALFADYPNIEVIRGRVPEVFATRCPDRIAFVHIDLNSATAEIGALDALYGRLSPGGVIVLDDYGWYSAREQFDEENRWGRERGLSILELPTGQGLLVKAGQAR